jgi:hypothetical protein
MKSRTVNLAGHVGRVRKKSVVYRCWCGSLKERGLLENRGVDRKLWVFKKLDMWLGEDWYSLGCGQVAGSRESGNEPSSCMKGDELLDWLEKS